MQTPDWFVVQELQRHDDKLGVRWDRRRERFVVTRIVPNPTNLYDMTVDILVVQNPDQSYRPLDMRTVRMLKASDHHTRGQKVVLNEIEESAAKAQRAKDRSWESHGRDFAKMSRKGYMKLADDMGVGAANVPKEDLRHAALGNA